MQVDDILGRLEKVRKSGQRWIARCPAHDVGRPRKAEAIAKESNR